MIEILHDGKPSIQAAMNFTPSNVPTTFSIHN